MAQGEMALEIAPRSKRTVTAARVFAEARATRLVAPLN